MLPPTFNQERVILHHSTFVYHVLSIVSPTVILMYNCMLYVYDVHCSKISFHHLN